MSSLAQTIRPKDLSMSISKVLAASFLALLLSGSSLGNGPKYTDPDITDADFAVQGEYSGTLDNGETYGIQIIAKGKGIFQAVGYLGGLPGQGWDGQTKDRVDGEMIDGKLTFKGQRGTAVFTDGKLQIKNRKDRQLGALARVQRKSPTLGMKPPSGAVVLFDGSNADSWHNGRIENRLLMEGITSKKKFQSHRLHIEFRLPYQPQDGGQGRGNSGLYLQGRYEVQMLDSFGLEGDDNECGGIYSIRKPDVNMCFPPLSWQTYDIDFTAAKCDQDGRMISKPHMTVWHNGRVIHENVELPKATTASLLQPGPDPGPVYLQDHSCPVRYRNIWVVQVNE